MLIADHNQTHVSVSGLTYKARRELHKAARRFLEVSSRILLRPLDGEKDPLKVVSSYTALNSQLQYCFCNLYIFLLKLQLHLETYTQYFSCCTTCISTSYSASTGKQKSVL